MAAPVMVSVAAARDRARLRAERDMREWAAHGGDDAVLAIPLNPPTERAALADLTAATAWVAQWRGVDAVEWGTRQWPSVGAQRVPERLVLRGPEVIAGFGSPALLRDWRTLAGRADRVRLMCSGAAPTGAVLDAEVLATDAAAVSAEAVSAAIRTHARAVLAMPETDFDRLLHVVAWLVAHPASGWRIRQLPIRGIDTKWLQAHRAVVEALHAAVSGRATLGLLAAPSLVRVRFLDPGLRPGGLADVAASSAELDALAARPDVVFILENLESVLAMPEFPGAVAIHGGGYGVAERVRDIRWVHQARVIYWGDLDSHGFGILNELRSVCPRANSVLMDDATLLAHRDLWVDEPTPARGSYDALTDAESATLARIRGEGNVRLEQERIAWGYALEELSTVLGTARVPSPAQY